METAIEWLLKEQFDLMMDYQNLTKRQYMSRKIRIQNKAKELEKEQIENAWVSGCKFIPFQNPREYYNQTYQNK